ncbi:DUF3472 domain-containing protein [Chitinophaga cymbidii]|uniref:DUF3472 domain-containing protein n=1 Tax=Chitinophaga cymbidii TaxID=1096750 RepID=A0A512RR15_9BACT|nr:hypothetical protein [Chitinophaga cymbidii]GEP98114.1 hypothetical protein CCY01nite_43740 [Chitinophaga cymbidii]
MYTYSPQHSPSIYFNCRINKKAVLISQQIKIPYSTPSTFYSVLNWNAGESYSSGYAGFQQLENGDKTAHFSLWSLEEDHPQFKPVRQVEGGIFDPFTNEKRGRKFVAPFDFMENVWYKFDIEITHPDANNTIYSFVITNVQNGESIQIVEMNYPVPISAFLRCVS